VTFVEDQAKAWCEIPALTRMSPDPLETVNGPGCTVQITSHLREELPTLLAEHNIRSVLDIGCGDWTWMQHVDLSALDSYLGWDVEPTQIEQNQRQFGDVEPFRRFECQNVLTAQVIPKVDLIIARQLLIHFPNAYIAGILDKFKASGSTYLLASHWPGTENKEYEAEGFSYRGYIERTTNFQAAPFNFPEPLDVIFEPALTEATESVLKDDHEMALWKLPPRTFHSRAYTAKDLEEDGFSVLGTVARWNKGLEAMYGVSAPDIPAGGDDSKDKLRRLRDNHREVIQTIGDDKTLAAVWLLLGAQSMVIDGILTDLIGD
jgi:SAM-dependent methyltransferase